MFGTGYFDGSILVFDGSYYMEYREVKAKGGSSSFAARSVGVLLLIIETGAAKGPQLSGVADASGWTGLQVSVNGSGSFSG